MMNKKLNSILIAYIVVLAVFSLMFFVIPFTRTPAVWVIFVFAEISILLGCGITYYAFNTDGGAKSKIYGFPVFRISYMYTLAQLAAAVVVFVINKFVTTPVWLSAVIGILLLAFVLIGTLAVDNARDIIAEVEQRTEQSLSQSKTFKLNISSLADSCTDKDAKKLLEKLSDKLKYSDPVSSPALADIEYRISQGIDELTRMTQSGNYSGIIEKINAVDRLVDDRNRQCKAGK